MKLSVVIQAHDEIWITLITDEFKKSVHKINDASQCDFIPHEITEETFNLLVSYL